MFTVIVPVFTECCHFINTKWFSCFVLLFPNVSLKKNCFWNVFNVKVSSVCLFLFSRKRIDGTRSVIVSYCPDNYNGAPVYCLFSPLSFFRLLTVFHLCHCLKTFLPPSPASLIIFNCIGLLVNVFLTVWLLLLGDEKLGFLSYTWRRITERVGLANSWITEITLSVCTLIEKCCSWVSA